MMKTEKKKKEGRFLLLFMNLFMGWCIYQLYITNGVNWAIVMGVLLLILDITWFIGYKWKKNEN